MEIQGFQFADDLLFIKSGSSSVAKDPLLLNYEVMVRLLQWHLFVAIWQYLSLKVKEIIVKKPANERRRDRLGLALSLGDPYSEVEYIMS